MSGIEVALLASAAASLAAGGIGAAGTIAQGNAQYAAAKNERTQMNRMASEELAVATRGAADKDREMKQLQSRGQAVAASSGGRATDETVLELVGNIAREGNVQKRDILRSGQVKADDIMYRGNVGVASAKHQKGLSKWAAGGQMLSAVADAAATGASAYSKYGGGAPKTTSPMSDYSGRPWYDEPGYKYPRL
jgi:hypothetical protein